MIIAVAVATIVALLIAFGGATRLFVPDKSEPSDSIAEPSEDGSWSPEELVALSGQPETASDPLSDERLDAVMTESDYAGPAPETAAYAEDEPAREDAAQESDRLVRLTREDIIYYAERLLPARLLRSAAANGRAASAPETEILRRFKPKLPDIFMVDDRVFALLIEKSRTLKLYLRAGTERVKALKARYGGKNASVSGGFYEWILPAGVRSKERIYGEIDDACAYASSLTSSDTRLINRLKTLLEEAAETDSFRRDDNFRRAVREKREFDEQYFAEHGKTAADISRASLLKLIDKYAKSDETRTAPDPEKSGKAVTAFAGGKPYLRLYEPKGRLRVRANIPYEYSVELLKKHPLVGKVGKSGTWSDVTIDDTFASRLDVYEIAEAAKNYTRETAFLSDLKKKR
jgi:hypothetical protein